MTRTRTLALSLGCALVACATPDSGRRQRQVRAHRPQPLQADAPIPKAMRVHVIDVGQGAATLLEFPCAAVLVDTGGEENAGFDSTQAINDYLGKFFARRLDLKRTFAAVFVTHPHIDHTRNLPGIMKRFAVEHLITNGLARDPGGAFFSGGQQQEDAEVEATGEQRLRIVRKDKVPRGGITDGIIDPVKCEAVDPKLSVLWGGLATNTEGWSGRTYTNANNHSLVVRVEVGGHALLITGDLEEEGIAALLALHEGTEVLDADVYQVGHHGSANGTTESLVTAVTPCTAVMAMGDSARQYEWTAWEYGHPRKPVVDLLERSLPCGRLPRAVPVGVGKRRFQERRLEHALYGTGWDGTVWVELTDGGGWKVSTER